TVAILLGGVIGLIFPMCECGIIPVMRRLLRKGLPLSCCIAYLLCGPIINFIVMLSTVVAFSNLDQTVNPRPESGDWSVQLGYMGRGGGGAMRAMRVGGGSLVAVVTALVVERVHAKHGDRLLLPIAQPSPNARAEDEKAEKKPWLYRLGNISQTALN